MKFKRNKIYRVVQAGKLSSLWRGCKGCILKYSSGPTALDYTGTKYYWFETLRPRLKMCHKLNMCHINCEDKDIKFKIVPELKAIVNGWI